MQTWDGLPVSREPPFGATITVWRDGDGEREWLLLHRAHRGRDYDGDWAWTPPSGARLPREPLEACARRELREETGLELSVEAVRTDGDWAVFVAEAPRDVDVRIDREHDAFAWLSLEEACARCLPRLVADALRLAAR